MSREHQQDWHHQIAETVLNFVTGRLPVRPNNFNLEGPVRDVPTAFKNFVSLFPSTLPGGEGTFAVIGLTSVEDGISVLSRVTKLKIPQRAKDLRMSNDQGMKSAAEIMARLLEYPTIVVAFGVTEDTQEEVAFLFCLPGVAPENALRDIQARARKKLASLS